MANSGDRYMMLFEQPMQNATSYWPAITDYIISLGVPQHSMVETGWGQEDGSRKTLMRVTLTVPKGTYTDPQILAIAQQIQTIIGKPLYTVEQYGVNVLFP